MNSWYFPFNPFLDSCGCYADLNYMKPESYEDDRVEVEAPRLKEYDYNIWNTITSLQWQLEQQQQANLHLRLNGYSKPSVSYNGIPHVWVPFQ